MAGRSKAESSKGIGSGGARPNTGGPRPNSGRPKGRKDAKTLRREAALARAAAKKLMPVEFLLAEMRNTENPKEMRLELARWCAPYVSPRLSSVEVVKSIRAMTTEELEWLINDARIGEPVAVRSGRLRIVDGGRR